MNGKPGDHPVSDVLKHGLAAYGEPSDTEIRKLAGFMDYHRLCEWFDNVLGHEKEDVATEVQKKLAEVLKDAKERGWEID
jgi:hypothetical protein